MDSHAEVHRAIAQARLAQQSWSSVRLRERAARIARFAGLVVEHRRELSDGVLYPTRGGYLETITGELIPLAQTAQCCELGGHPGGRDRCGSGRCNRVSSEFHEAWC